MTKKLIVPIPPEIEKFASTIVRSAKTDESRRIYRLDLMYFWDWIRLQNLTYQSFTEDSAFDYRDYLQSRYAKATAQRMLSVTKLLFEKLERRGVIGFNPFEDVKGFALDNESSHKSLTKDEARNLLKAINTDTSKGQRDYAIISLLVRTGLRRFECVALDIGDITKEQGHNIAIVRHGKGDKRRKVKLPVDVFRTIEVYIASRKYSSLNDPLFVGFDRRPKYAATRISAKVIERIVSTYGEKIGYVGAHPLTPHDLRSTFITLALEENAPLTKVQYAAGHADPRTTERYQKRKLNLDDNAVDYIKL